VHYTHKRPDGDKSGVRLKLTDDVLPFSAGMMMYASYFQIPPQTPSHLVPTRCCYAGFEPTHGFAFRVHTHALGRCARPPPGSLTTALFDGCWTRALGSSTSALCDGRWMRAH
jgi:hypothetical protein